MKKLNSPNNIHHLAFLCRDAEQKSKSSNLNFKIISISLKRLMI